MARQYLDVELITLAYYYLSKKPAPKNRPYNVGDLLTVAEKILQWAENNGEFRNLGRKIIFKKGMASIDEKIFKSKKRRIYERNKISSVG